MALRLSAVLVFIALVGMVATHAAVSPEDYWKTVLPNTPMPKSVSHLLQPDSPEDKSTSVAVGKGGVDVDAGKGKPGATSVNVGKDGVDVDAGRGKPGGGNTSVNVGKPGVGVSTGEPGRKTNVSVGIGGVSVNTRREGKPVGVRVRPGPNPFVYNYKATKRQLLDSRNVAVFFVENDLHTGKTMNLHFTKNPSPATFLPRKMVQTIPFSSKKLPETLNKFLVKLDSIEAETMANTFKDCEQPAMKGEEKYCATLLESMVDFSTSKLGRNVEAISIYGGGQENPNAKV